MAIVMIGLEHSSAPLDLLERVVINDVEMGKVLGSLSAHDNVREVAILSTCLRTEIYAVVDRFHDAVEDFTEIFVTSSGVSRERIEECQTVCFDRGVATHLFKVASGLESVVPGESEVLGQVRRAHERAIQEGTAGPLLTALFIHALQTGRRARTETGISRGTTSFSYEALELLRQRLGDAFGEASIVIVGVGALGSGMVNALVDEKSTMKPRSVVVMNRTKASADEFVKSLSTSVPLRVAPFGALADEIAAAQIVVTAIESTEPVLRGEHVASESGRELLILDLGMPRNVHHDVATLPGVHVLGISDLQSVVDQAVSERKDEIADAQEIVLDEVARYGENVRGRSAAPLVVALRERLEEIRRGEIDRRSSELSDLTPEQREVVESLTRSLLAKFAHEPTVALKESVGTPRGERLVEAARIFFDL